MSDVPNAGGGAVGDEPVLPNAGTDAGTGVDPAAAQSGTDTGGGLAGLTGESDGDGGEPAAPSDWPSDWRERLAGSDEAALRLAKRFGSPEGVWKKLLNQEKLLSDRSQHRALPQLPDNATEEQVAEYRKALGIPETPDGYGVEFSAELKGDENLNAMLQSYLKFAHERNIAPSAVKAAVEWQQSEILRQRSEQDAAAVRAAYEVKTQLQREYGADFKRNQTLALEWLEGYPGLKRAIEMMPMADIEVTRDLVRLVLETAPEDRLFSGDGASGGKSIDEQISELRTKSVTGKLTASEDKRYMDLLAARERRNARQNRAA